MPTAWLFERGVDRVSGLSNSPLGLARNLIITNTVLNREGRVSLRGRDLRYATLTHVILRHADFTGADLTHADFSGSDLTAACFGCADTGRKKRLRRRNESGETWEDEDPQVQCTNLLHATLNKARLDGAVFSGGDAGERQPLTHDAGKDGVATSLWPSINLSGISLVGAHFNKIVLQGWNFDEADLTAATFDNVDASFASFRSTDLRAATFEDSELTAADFSPIPTGKYRTFLEGVIFSNTRMPFADFFQVTLWRTSLPDWDNDSLHSALEFATFEGAKIIKPMPDEKQGLREWVKGLEDSRLQRRVRDALKPLLEEAPWTGRDRKLWEAFIAPLDGGSTAPVAQRLQARLQFIRKRTEMLAKDYCTERAKWIVWSKVNDISDVLMDVYKPNGEKAQPDEPNNAEQSSENGKSTRDERLRQRLKQALAPDANKEKATQPKQEERTELPPLSLFDPEVFNEHCGNRNEKTRLDKDLIRRWQGWINHLKKAAK